MGGGCSSPLFEAVSRRKVPARVETVVHAVGFLVLLGVVLTVALADLRQHLRRTRTAAVAPPATSPAATALPAPAAPDAGLPLRADELGD